MGFQNCRDCLAIPAEDEIPDGARGAHAARAKYRDALASFAADAVVGDSVGVFPSQRDAELLGGGVVGLGVDPGEFALTSAQVVEVGALHRRFQNLEIQILGGCARRLEEGDAVVLYLCDGGRFVPRCVVDAERIGGQRGRTEASAVGRRIDEGRHHVAGAGTEHPVLGRNREASLYSRVNQGVRAGAQRRKRFEIVRIDYLLKDFYRRKDGRDELYGLFPGQPLR